MRVLLARAVAIRTDRYAGQSCVLGVGREICCEILEIPPGSNEAAFSSGGNAMRKYWH